MMINGKDKKKMLPPKNGFCSAKKEDAPQNPFFGSAFFSYMILFISYHKYKKT